MEQVECNCCGNAKTELFREAECIAPKKASFTLVRCNQCGLVYLNPRPEKKELAEFYPFWSASSDCASQNYISAQLNWKGQKRKLSLLKKYLTNRAGKILDIGSGTGEFLVMMRKQGWQVFGVEYASVTSDFARNRFNLDVATKDLLEANFPEKYFDLITLWDSLEHFYQPKETLIEVNRILRDDGLLVLSVPNINNLAFRLFKDCWYTNVPRHLYQFNLETLALLLAKANFKVARIIHHAGYFEPVGLVVTFKIWLCGKLCKKAKQITSLREVSAQDRLISALPILKSAVRLLTELLFLPLSLLSIGLKKSPQVTVFARKC